MENPPSVLIVELLMSADRIITAALDADTRDRDTDTRDRATEEEPGGWPPATIVGHLSMVDTDVWAPRIDRMVAARAGGDEPPRFGWWEPDSAATEGAFAGVGVEEASARLLATRTALLHRLRELSSDDWRASAHHDEFGTLDIQGIVMLVLGHDEEHRASLVSVVSEPALLKAKIGK